VPPRLKLPAQGDPLHHRLDGRPDLGRLLGQGGVAIGSDRAEVGQYPASLRRQFEVGLGLAGQMNEGADADPVRRAGVEVRMPPMKAAAVGT
jgi:hypothetical protein